MIFSIVEVIQSLCKHRSSCCRAWLILQAYTEPGRTHEALPSVRAAAGMLDHFTDRFQMKYPLPKLDFVAVPGSFYLAAY